MLFFRIERQVFQAGKNRKRVKIITFTSRGGGVYFEAMQQIALPHFRPETGKLVQLGCWTRLALKLLPNSHLMMLGFADTGRVLNKVGTAAATLTAHFFFSIVCVRFQHVETQLVLVTSSKPKITGKRRKSPLLTHKISQTFFRKKRDTTNTTLENGNGSRPKEEKI